MAKKQRRIDPKSRIPDGARPWDKLKNADPGKHYVYVNPNDDQFGVDFYEAIGYVQELRTEGGVAPAVGKVKGDSDGVISVMGHVLMSIDRADKEALDQYGVGGSGGQEAIDHIEETIVKAGGVDGLRGMQGVFAVKNETEKLRQVNRLDG